MSYSAARDIARSRVRRSLQTQRICNSKADGEWWQCDATCYQLLSGAALRLNCSVIVIQWPYDMVGLWVWRRVRLVKPFVNAQLTWLLHFCVTWFTIWGFRRPTSIYRRSRQTTWKCLFYSNTVLQSEAHLVIYRPSTSRVSLTGDRSRYAVIA